MQVVKIVREYWWTIMPIVFLIYKFGIQPHYESGLIEYGKSSVAVITNVRLKSIGFDFDANGLTYSSTTDRTEIPSVMTNYLKRGEKYEIRYDSVNPHNNKIYLWKPVIDSTFVSTNGFNVKSISDRIVEFEYFVKQRKYMRYQMINEEIFVLKGEYQVLYLDNKPEIAYIIY